MGISELYKTIAGVTLKYDFAAPVTAEDCEQVRSELAEVLPKEHRVQVAEVEGYVEVSVYDAASVRYYQRRMIVY